MTTLTPLRHPGVRFPPPIIYVAAFVIAWLINRVHPLSMTHATSTSRSVAGILLLIIGVALASQAFARFFQARTTFIPHRPATALVTTGPYRFTRNPMYLGMVAIYLACALFLNSWWPIAFLPLVVLVVQRAVIEREERYLASAFPEYPEYCRRVRRWL